MVYGYAHHIACLSSASVACICMEWTGFAYYHWLLSPRRVNICVCTQRYGWNGMGPWAHGAHHFAATTLRQYIIIIIFRLQIAPGSTGEMEDKHTAIAESILIVTSRPPNRPENV